MLTKITLPKTHSYHTDSEHPPLELYLNVLPVIKTMDLELGFFSSAVFSVLSVGMAQFIQNGVRLRIVTNKHILEKDSDFIFSNGKVSEEAGKYIKDPNKLKELQKILEKRERHFYNCLLYLKNKGRLIIQPIQQKSSLRGLPHSKICVVSDGVNKLYCSGSANFTASAFLVNTENIDVSPT